MKHHSIYITKDGSPTLNFFEADDVNAPSEYMHNKSGAISETLHVYLNGIEFPLKYNLPLNYLSVGFGLGYVEMALIAFLISKKVDLDKVFISTFESDIFLIEEFKNWIFCDKKKINSFENDDKKILNLQDCYFFIARQMSLMFEIRIETFLNAMCKMIQDKNWIFLGALKLTSDFKIKNSSVFYDAFSSKINPELWVFECLKNLIDNGVFDIASFSTYSAQSRLKKILKTAGFDIVPRSGFAGKRECTLAFRGLPIKDEG